MFGFHEIDAATLKEWLDEKKSLRLVDVRTPAEMARGVIPGADLIPLHLIPIKINEFEPGERIVVYCQSGARSAQACAFMAQHGIDEVYNLRGGIMGWVGSGFQLTAPSGDVLGS